MAERLPPGAFHQYVPLDHRPWVRRFLDHWRPALVLWAESELWPNALAEIAGRGIPAVLVNARLSARSYRGWRRWPGTAGAVLRTFAAVLAQSPEDAQRFAALGARGVRCVGNLKAAAAALPVDETALSAMKAAIGARPAWLAASIHPGEDRIVADTHRALAPRHPGLLSIVVPRHPDKAEAMAALIAATGLRVARRSGGAVLTPDCDVYMADTLGELGLWYRACDLVFVGKSFAVGGGQNPAEPAKLGCAIVCGPDMSNFADLAARLRDAGALRVAETPAALVAILADLLGDPARRRALGAAAAQVLSAEGTALAETLAVLEPWLAVPIDCP
jgi:3-deoxy-D-manno-octulosonic-acid transferase